MPTGRCNCLNSPVPLTVAEGGKVFRQYECLTCGATWGKRLLPLEEKRSLPSGYAVYHQEHSSDADSADGTDT